MLYCSCRVSEFQLQAAAAMAELANAVQQGLAQQQVSRATLSLLVTTFSLLVTTFSLLVTTFSLLVTTFSLLVTNSNISQHVYPR
jgi:hypothetical protein